ncbi:MAG: isochorismate synthase MenF [Rhodocyclaceae bacterium]
MIDWPRIAATLARLTAGGPAARMISLTLPLPGWPSIAPEATEEWCFWHRPDQGLRLVGTGCALRTVSTGKGRFAALAAAERGLLARWRFAGPAPRAFAGFAFAPEGGEPLPNASLWVPELLVSESAAGVTLTLSCAAEATSGALERWQALWHEVCHPRISRRATALVARPSKLAEQAFLARGRAALAAIEAGYVDKLVLTIQRRFSGGLGQPLAALLDILADRHPNCATFAVGGRGWSFVGASPETLLALEGGRVAVDAIAGTAWRDAARALGDDKNRREHDFVVRAIEAALTGPCEDIALPAAPEVMQLEGLSHLRRRIQARRPPGLGAFELIARLHPTPAVGGLPAPAALDWLARHRDTRGAWYTGGFGWLDATGNADIAVCLRCGLIEGERITLYAGAGFVAGSDPAQELAETEAKLATMRAALLACQYEQAAA